MDAATKLKQTQKSKRFVARISAALRDPLIFEILQKPQVEKGTFH